jgi:hypothetical protein
MQQRRAGAHTAMTGQCQTPRIYEGAVVVPRIQVTQLRLQRLVGST